MNVVMIMAGGVGNRFGAVIPKQYNLIAGKPVIDYVIDAVEQSTLKDGVVVVMDRQWIGYSEKLLHADYDIADNGNTRLESVQNGLKLIHDRYACNKLVIVDAVAPFITGKIIDGYFEKLDEYDAVITAQKITGGFTDIYNHSLDREQYIVTQSPEGFRFPLFWNHFDVHFSYQEMACMLPQDAKRYYNYDFKNNLKLTYDFELSYAEAMLRNFGALDSNHGSVFFDKDILITEGLRSYLLRVEPQKTMQWLDDIYSIMPELINRWAITSFLPNQTSRYGLILQAKSTTYGNVVLKFIPQFVDRFERELEAMRLLPKSYMCDILDSDEQARVMLLKGIEHAKWASFEENLKLTRMFECAIKDAIPYSKALQICHIPLYYEELVDKLKHSNELTCCRESVTQALEYAVALYEKQFMNAELYVLHGDLHEMNILDDGKRFWAIDPNGMIAPIELECVRFIRNDVRNHVNFGRKERFDLLLHNFSRFVNEKKLVMMFIIDMAFCTYNSLFENENLDETYVDLELIDIAKNRLAEYTE